MTKAKHPKKMETEPEEETDPRLELKLIVTDKSVVKPSVETAAEIQGILDDTAVRVAKLLGLADFVPVVKNLGD